MNTEAQIAVAWGSPGGATAEVSNAIEGLVGKRPKPIRLTDLAGPNETIQILLSAEDWIIVAKAVAAIYGAELIKEAAKATWKAAAPKFDQVKNDASSYFSSFISAIRQALFAKAPVIFGFPRTPVHGRRHIGVEISDASPEEIGRIVTILAMNGDEINLRLDEWDSIRIGDDVSYAENSDCSVKITITDEGAIDLEATIFNNSSRTREVIQYELSTKRRKDG